MKGQDILILFKLVSLQLQRGDSAYLVENTSARALESSLGVSKSEVNSSINRSIESGLIVRDRQHGYPKVNTAALLEFVCSGLKYVFPVKPAELVRGIPTAFDAPVLQGELESLNDIKYVWPSANGSERGQAIKPLFKTVPEACEKDKKLYRFLALVDAIRLGNPRESKLAQKLLKSAVKEK
ncbi:MAG: hypothetical protein OEZ47_07580 [Gammaproteobacteria bacterium]|nr:hypothetical protein [Gammaproteobacteria bacterium]